MRRCGAAAGGGSEGGALLVRVRRGGVEFELCLAPGEALLERVRQTFALHHAAPVKLVHRGRVVKDSSDAQAVLERAPAALFSLVSSAEAPVQLQERAARARAWRES